MNGRWEAAEKTDNTVIIETRETKEENVDQPLLLPMVSGRPRRKRGSRR